MAARSSLMEFQVPKITHEEVTENRGVFVIEPLDRGFGYTFGNSLRRVLLSSLEGAAVTSVKIEGTAHEFTTLPGVREDATELTAQVPAWLQADHDSLSARVLRHPERKEIAAPVQEQLIVELYSK